MLARTLNLLLGQWLIVSALLWRHGPAQLTNTVIVGVLCMAVAFLALMNPVARRWNLLLSGWLLVSTLTLPHHPATVWNNVVVALAIFALALVRTPEAEQPARPLTLDERLRIIADEMARRDRTA